MHTFVILCKRVNGVRNSVGVRLWPDSKLGFAHSHSKYIIPCPEAYIEHNKLYIFYYINKNWALLKRYCVEMTFLNKLNTTVYIEHLKFFATILSIYGTEEVAALLAAMLFR